MDDAQMLVLDMGSRNYSCAQIVMAGGLQLMGRENPDLIRAMAGLSQGVGDSGEICGALSGGVCLLALHTAKGMDGEEALPHADPLMNELVEWFRAEKGVDGLISCDALLATAEECGGAREMCAGFCGSLVAEVWRKAVSLLMENGIDPSAGREEL